MASPVDHFVEVPRKSKADDRPWIRVYPSSRSLAVLTQDETTCAWRTRPLNRLSPECCIVPDLLLHRAWKMMAISCSVEMVAAAGAQPGDEIGRR